MQKKKFFVLVSAPRKMQRKKRDQKNDKNNDRKESAHKLANDENILKRWVPKPILFWFFK